MHNNVTTISATEATRTFSDVLNKVYYQDKTFEIKRGREVVARLIPIQRKTDEKTLTTKEMKCFFEQLPALGEKDREAFETTVAQLRAKNKIEHSKWD